MDEQASGLTVEAEEDGWQNVTMASSSASTRQAAFASSAQSAQRSEQLDSSASLNREAITNYSTHEGQSNFQTSSTASETHSVFGVGPERREYTEEHWTSEIESIKTGRPPKFIQVIQSYRVLASDTLTLVVEVASDPPAIFEWFANDRRVHNSRKFRVRHLGPNVTSLTVEGPDQGVYKCTATNPAGISTTYGYVTVTEPPKYKQWVVTKSKEEHEEGLEINKRERVQVGRARAPKFINQVPHLTLKPGAEAVIDVEVESDTAVRFTWFVNGFEWREQADKLLIQQPTSNRCIARFPIPRAGEYKVIATNQYGSACSVGRMDIQAPHPPLPPPKAKQQASTMSQSATFRGSSTGLANTNYTTSYQESSYFTRSSSLPRGQKSSGAMIPRAPQPYHASTSDLFEHHQADAETHYHRQAKAATPQFEYRASASPRASTPLATATPPPFTPSLHSARVSSSYEHESNMQQIQQQQFKAITPTPPPTREIYQTSSSYEQEWRGQQQQFKTITPTPPPMRDVYQTSSTQQQELNIQQQHQFKMPTPPPPSQHTYQTSSTFEQQSNMQQQHMKTPTPRPTPPRTPTYHTTTHEEVYMEERHYNMGRPSPSPVSTYRASSVHEQQMTEQQQQHHQFRTITPSPSPTVTSTTYHVAQDQEASLQQQSHVNLPKPTPPPAMPTYHTTSTHEEQFYVQEQQQQRFKPVASPAPPPVRPAVHTTSIHEQESTLQEQQQFKVKRPTPPPQTPTYHQVTSVHEQQSTLQEEQQFKVKRPTPPPMPKYQTSTYNCDRVYYRYVNGFEARQGTIMVDAKKANECYATFTRPKTGEYKVIAYNSVGQASSSGRVTVEEPPKPPSPPPQEQESQTVVLEELLITDAVEIVETGRTPVFIEPVPEIITLTQAQSELSLRVELDALPCVDKVKWFVDGYDMDLVPKEAVESTHMENSATLMLSTEIINELVSGAVITCRATNEIGTAVSEGRVEREQPLPAPTAPVAEPAPLPSPKQPGGTTIIHREQIYEERETKIFHGKSGKAEPAKNLPRAPRFTRELPSEMNIMEGDKLQFQVAVEAEPPVMFSWYINGFELRQSTKVTIDETTMNQSALSLPTIDKTGEYKVVAKNKLGDVSSSCRVEIERSGRSEITKSPVPPDDQYIYVQEVREIEESRNTTDVSLVQTQQPPEFIESFVAVISAAGVATAADDEELNEQALIEKLAQEDWELVDDQDETGSYKSAASFLTAESFATARTAQMTETQQRQQMPSQQPQLLPPVQSQTLPPKPIRKVEAKLAPASAPSIQPIPIYEKSEEVEIESHEELLIKMTEPKSDRPIPQKPRIIAELTPEITVPAGETLVLHFQVDSFPEATFSWYVNNFEVRHSAHIRLESPGPNQSQATFFKPTDGNYKVVAKNDLGTAISVSRVVIELPSASENEEDFVTVAAAAEESRAIAYKPVASTVMPTEKSKSLPKPPVITKHLPPEIRVPHGEPLTLDVEVDAIPAVSLTWYANKFEVRQSSTINIETPQANVGRATFAEPSDGLYKVIAKNELGTATSTTRVLVELPPDVQTVQSKTFSAEQLIESSTTATVVKRRPSFIRTLQNQTFVEEESVVELEVQVDAEPPATFQWFVNGTPVEPSQNVRIEQVDASTSRLRIEKVVLKQVDYAVEVSNICGSIWTETRLISTPKTSQQLLQQPTKPMISHETWMRPTKTPRFLNELQAQDVRAGSQAVATASVEDDAAPCTFTWFLNGTELKESAMVSVESTSSESTLILHKVTTETDGMLSVVAKNELGSAESSAYLQVHTVEPSQILSPIEWEITPEKKEMVTVRLSGQGPQFTVRLEPIVVKDGQPLHLRCCVEGAPCPTTKWYKDGVDVDTWVLNKDVITRHDEEGWCELLNPEVYPEDSGEYRCVATNALGTTATVARVTVEGHTYLQDSEEASMSASYTRSFTHTSAMAPEIQSHSEVHSGQLDVSQESLMEIVEIAQIAVDTQPQSQSAPEFTVTLTTESVLEGNEIKLWCQVTGVPRPVVNWLHNEENVRSTERTRIVENDDGSHYLWIRNAIIADAGLYVCRAANPLGTAETAAGLRVALRDTTEGKTADATSESVVALKKTAATTSEDNTTTTIETEYVDYVNVIKSSVIIDDVMIELEREEEAPLVEGTQQIQLDERQEKTEEYVRFANIERNAEEYSLLVHVATAIANVVVVAAFEEAIDELYTINEVDEEVEDEQSFASAQDVTISEQSGCPPEFQGPIESKVVKVGDTVKLKSNLSGYPVPEVHWYLDGDEIRQSETFQSIFDDGVVLLTISNIRAEDEGEYFCFARNQFGEVAISCYITVHEHAVIDTRAPEEQQPLPILVTYHEATHESRVEVAYAEEGETIANVVVEVTKPDEHFEHIVAILQPVVTAISAEISFQTSYTESMVRLELVVEEETILRAEIEREQEINVVLNVFANRPEAVFHHDVIILQPAEDTVMASMTSHQWIVRTEEITQTTHEMEIIGEQQGKQPVNSTNLAVHVVKPEESFQHDVNVLTTIDEELHLEMMTLVEKTQTTANAVVNVEAHRPNAAFDHVLKIVEPELESTVSDSYFATKTQEQFVADNVNIAKSPEKGEKTVILHAPSLHTAHDELKIVQLESAQTSFVHTETWSETKLKATSIAEGAATAVANVEVRRPEDTAEHILTVYESARLSPDSANFVETYSSDQLVALSISLTRPGDYAEQAVILSGESMQRSATELDMTLLQAVFSQEFSEQTALLDEMSVEIDANCPAQTSELVASVTMPERLVHLIDIRQISPDRSSISETSSTGFNQPPRFVQQLTDQSVSVGQTTQLKCIVTGWPMPEVNWFVDGDQINSSNDFPIVFEDGICLLRIKELFPEDEGEYTCEAVSEAGRATGRSSTSTVSSASLRRPSTNATDEQTTISDFTPTDHQVENISLLSSAMSTSDLQAIEEDAVDAITLFANLQPGDVALLVEMVQPEELLETTARVLQLVWATAEASTQAVSLPEKSATLVLDITRPIQREQAVGLLAKFARPMQMPDQLTSSLVGHAVLCTTAASLCQDRCIAAECDFSKVEESASSMATFRGPQATFKQPPLGISTSFDTEMPASGSTRSSPTLTSPTSPGFESIADAIVQVSQQLVDRPAPVSPAHAQVNYELLWTHLAETIASAQEGGPMSDVTRLTPVLGVMQAHLNDLETIIHQRSEQSTPTAEQDQAKTADAVSSLKPLIGQIQRQLSEIGFLLQQQAKAKKSETIAQTASKVHEQLTELNEVVQQQLPYASRSMESLILAEIELDISENQEIAQVFQEIHRRPQTESVMITALIATDSEEQGGSTQTDSASRSSEETVSSQLIESAILEAANSIHSGASMEELVNSLAETIKNGSLRTLTKTDSSETETTEIDANY
uniref:Ig-like domain-containing protein n=2 Tax=Plectus sambesii TaxID=2011161 RepID=A0A914WIF3_9BILA